MPAKAAKRKSPSSQPQWPTLSAAKRKSPPSQPHCLLTHCGSRSPQTTLIGAISLIWQLGQNMLDPFFQSGATSLIWQPGQNMLDPFFQIGAISLTWLPGRNMLDVHAQCCIMMAHTHCCAVHMPPFFLMAHTSSTSSGPQAACSPAVQICAKEVPKQGGEEVPKQGSKEAILL
eukprot:1157707-Pelagomonas_calceolata.AAC.1